MASDVSTGRNFEAPREREVAASPQPPARNPHVAVFDCPLPTQEVKVAKALISKVDLELIALQEIRSFPGSEHLLSVEVDYEANQPQGINWTLCVIANDGGDLDRIQLPRSQAIG
jgi:hypothetical protein